MEGQPDNVYIPADPLMAQRALERHDFLDDIVAHVVAVIMSLGFFIIVMVALLGYADLNSSTVAAFVGTALGYAAAKLDPIFTRYYHVTLNTQRAKSMNDKAAVKNGTFQ